MKGDAVDEPAENFFDDCKAGVTLAELLGGVHFAAGDVMLIVWAEDTVDLVKEVASCRQALLRVTLLEDDEVIHIHICVGEALLLPPGRECGEVFSEISFL